MCLNLCSWSCHQLYAGISTAESGWVLETSPPRSSQVWLPSIEEAQTLQRSQKGILEPFLSPLQETGSQLHLNESTAPSGGIWMLGHPGSQNWEEPGTRIADQEGSSNTEEGMWVKGGSEGQIQGEITHSYFTKRTSCCGALETNPTSIHEVAGSIPGLT